MLKCVVLYTVKANILLVTFKEVSLPIILGYNFPEGEGPVASLNRQAVRYIVSVGGDKREGFKCLQMALAIVREKMLKSPAGKRDIYIALCATLRNMAVAYRKGHGVDADSVESTVIMCEVSDVERQFEIK